MDLSELIKKQRQIKENSLKAYLISLKKLNDNKPLEDLDFLKDKKSVMEKLEKLALPTQKNYLTAILVGLKAIGAPEKLIDSYKSVLDDKNEEYNKRIKTNKKTEKQEENWVEWPKILEVRNNLKKRIMDHEIHQRQKLNNKQRNLLIEYLVASLYTYQPVIRLDYAPMYIIKSKKEIKPGKNYLLKPGRNKSFFILQEFKNSKSHPDVKPRPIPPKLNTIINLYLKHHPQEKGEDGSPPFFLMNSRGGELTPNGLGKLITKTFKETGKKITLNLLRHIFITHQIPPDLKEKQKKLAESMLHSVAQQEDYLKI